MCEFLSRFQYEFNDLGSSPKAKGAVLKHDSENGLSFDTRGRLRLVDAPSSDRSPTKPFDIIGTPLSLCTVMLPGSTL